MSQYESYMPYSTGANNIEAVNSLFRKVYQYMAMGLIVTALVAYLTASSRFMVNMLFTSSAPIMIIAVLEVVLVIWLGAKINTLSQSAALTLFMLYSVLNGVMCSALLLVYTNESVYKAFMSTAAMFGAMSIYGLYTKRDLTSFGSFLRMGLIGLLIAMLVSIFTRSNMFELCISVMAIIIFMGLTAYDTAKIKHMAYEVYDDEVTGKVAVMGALMLYLDFVNLFIHLLRIFGRERN